MHRKFAGPKLHASASKPTEEAAAGMRSARRVARRGRKTVWQSG